MFAEGQPLALVGRSEGCAIQLGRNIQHPVVYNLEEGLTIMDQKRNIVWTDFQYHLSSVYFAAPKTKAGIEEPRIMGPEFPAGRFVSNHLGRIARGHADPFFRSKDIELFRLQQETVLAMPIQWFPEIE